MMSSAAINGFTSDLHLRPLFAFCMIMSFCFFWLGYPSPDNGQQADNVLASEKV